MAIQADDFSGESLTGSIDVASGQIIFDQTVQPIDFEGNKTFKITFRKSDSTGQVLFTTSNIILNDTSSITEVSPNVQSIYEGEQVRFQISSANVTSPNVTLYYSTAGNVNYNDLLTSNVGLFYLLNGSGNVILTANSDLSDYVETGEQFRLQIRRDSTTGEILNTSADSVNIIDSSNVIALTQITVFDNSLTATEAAIFTMDTINALGNGGGTLYYTITGNADLYSSTSGSIIINDNTANLEIITESSGLSNDNTQFAVQIRRSSTSGTILGTSETISVTPESGYLATSRVSHINDITPNVQYVAKDGGSVGFTVNVISSYEGELLDYYTEGDVSNSSFYSGNTGSLAISANTGTIILQTTASFANSFIVKVKRPGGKVLGESSTVDVLSTIEATGGTTYTSDGYKYHLFTTGGTFAVSSISSNSPYNTIEYLTLAGGGGGGGKRGGGGGAGGLVTGNHTATPSTSITVSVGGGGNTATGEGAVGTSGGSTTLTGSVAVTATGGGRGGAQGPSQVVPWPGLPGSPGGSGGGGGRNDGAPPATTGLNGTGIPGQGNPGGTNPSPNAGSGGGGFGSAGEPSIGPVSAGGAGGSGTTTYNPWLTNGPLSSFTGIAGGGGGGGPGTHPTGGKPPGIHGGGDGGKDTNNTAPTSLATAGVQYSGGGGGGGPNSTFISGGAGGSGMVIFRYRIS